MLNAARAGNVTIANAVGNGVADDKLVYTYVPEMIRYYLGEEPILPNVDTYRLLADPTSGRTCSTGSTSWCVKPVDGSGGYGIVIGPQATDARAGRGCAGGSATTRAAGSPSRWCSCRRRRRRSATGCAPRHVDLRPFAVNDGETVWVLPGGLTRVALPEGSLVVNSSQGGGSKDTWVLAAGRATRTPSSRARPARRLAAVAPAGRRRRRARARS